MTLAKIAPSVLSADFGSLATDIKQLETWGADLIHIDVMDGSFVPPISFGDNMVSVCKANSNLFREAHLMIRNPEAHIETYAKAGAQRILVHIEATNDLAALLKMIRANGADAGVVINPDTPAESIFPYLTLCQVALVMTVQPGWGGQAFREDCFPKIGVLKNEIEKQKLSTLIEVDGGINDKTASRCIAAGATLLVAGSYVFKQTDRAAAIRSLR